MKDPTIRLGVVIGGILGAFYIFFNIMNYLMNLQGTPYDLLIITLLVVLTTFLFLAGYFTGQVKSGMMSGFIAGLVSAVIGIISMWVITLLFFDIVSRNMYLMMNFINSGVPTMRQFIIEDAASTTVVEFIGSLVLGTFLGSLGGWAGSWRTPSQIHI